MLCEDTYSDEGQEKRVGLMGETQYNYRRGTSYLGLSMPNGVKSRPHLFLILYLGLNYEVHMVTKPLYLFYHLINGTFISIYPCQLHRLKYFECLFCLREVSELIGAAYKRDPR